MSAMANTTPIVTTITKAANKEKTPKEAGVALKVNILDFCEEHYEDILPVIIDKVCRDKRKEVHARLDFGESPKKSQRVREGSQNSSAATLPASDTYSPSTTKSGPDRENPRDRSHSRGRPHKRDSSPSKDRLRTRDCLRGIKESYGDPEDHVKIFQAAAHVERWAMPTWCHMFNSTLIGTARVWFDELPPESIDRYKDLKAAFLAYFMKQKKYVKEPVEIHNIKQGDGETIEDFIERFNVETRRMKGALERIMTRQKVTQSFARVREITFPPLATSRGTEGPLVIEAEISEHMIHHIYIDGGSSTKVLYEHCFNRLQPKIKRQKVPATTSLTSFSGETIWPLGKLRLLVIIGDADHSKKAWMNFMIVRSLSPYNGIIGRHGIREIQAVPSTAHGMLKFPVDRGIVTIRSTILKPTECAIVTTTSKGILKEKKRGQAPRLAKAIQVKVQKLVEAGIMREVYYHDWLSNRVMVPLPEVAGGQSFDSPVGRNIEVCVDDLVIKIPTETEMLRDIDGMFFYFVSRVLNGSELNYTTMEKLVLALVFATKRAIKKWRGMLGKHNIMYRPRTIVKGKVLLDFLVEKLDEALPDTSAVETVTPRQGGNTRRNIMDIITTQWCQQ
nr:reverse transcriptase domain-containing protein [Tanacetum cinerariifolium]